jgi:hypothetical protein
MVAVMRRPCRAGLRGHRETAGLLRRALDQPQGGIGDLVADPVPWKGSNAEIGGIRHGSAPETQSPASPVHAACLM